jgi:hypothetical protein
MIDSLRRFKVVCDRCHTMVCNGSDCDGQGAYYDVDGIREYVDSLEKELEQRRDNDLV